MLNIRHARLEEAKIIHQLAHLIYYPTYTGILSKGQMDFMLQKSYTEEALKESMMTDQIFYLVLYNDIPVGFMALKEKDSRVLRIEKLYILPETQGKGIGKELIDFTRIQAQASGKATLELNVNRGNTAYEFYKKVGFKVVEEVDIPYYGYILDDYVMQMEI